MRARWLILLLPLTVAACVTVPPLQPVSMDELVTLAKEGPNGAGLVTALRTRPLAFPLDYEHMKELSKRGVSNEVINTVLSLSIDRRARAIAPRYSNYYDYYWGPYWGPYWYPYGYWGPYWRGSVGVRYYW